MRGKKRTVIFSMLCIFLITLIGPSIVRAATRKVPGKFTMTHNQWGSDVDGDYDLTLNMWYGNNATSYKVYERFGPKGEFTVVNEGSLEDNTPNPQEIKTEVRGRDKTGMYYYYAELINEHGSVETDMLTITVGSVEKASIYIEEVDDLGVQTQFTVGQGVTEYKLSHISSQENDFEVISNNKSVAKASIVNGGTLKIEAIGHGRSGLKIVHKKTGDVRHIGVRVRKQNGELPGMPDYLSVGQVSEDIQGDLDFWRDIDNDYTNKRTDVRYIYVNGGPFTGWRTWTSEDGGRVKSFIKESRKQGMIPFFVYYNIPAESEDYNIDLEHINDPKYMEAYFKDLKFFLDICKEYGQGDTVGIVFEPDFLGYMMQQSGKEPHQITAAIEAAYSSGVLEKGKDPQFEANLPGLVEAINYTVKKYCEEAYFGWQFNIWSYSGQGVPGQGLLHQTEYLGWEKGRDFIKEAAKKTVDFYEACNIKTHGADFISIDKYGLDGAFESGAPEDPEKSRWFFNADIWNNYLLYVETLHKETNLPAILWQIPVGHINGSTSVSPYTNKPFEDLKNVAGSYEDSATTYFFGDTFKAGGSKRLDYFGKNEANDPKIKVQGDTITWEDHMEETKKAGIVSVLFGAGVGASTDAVGSPPTDNYFWITKAQHYYDNVIMLDGNGGGTPVDKPLKPIISANPLENKGDYTVNISIPQNSKGDKYKLYENDKLIKEEAINSDAKTIGVNFKGKKEGSYRYRAELINKDGASSSETIEVKVTSGEVIPPPVVELPKKPSLSVDSKENKGDYTITLTIPKDSKGESYKLYENGVEIESKKVTSEGLTIAKEFKNKKDGEYIYRLELINKDGKTSSDNLVITVKNEVAPPSESKLEASFKVTSDWGSGANYDFILTNKTGKDIVDWKVTFKCEKKITSNWNADIKDLGNGLYEISPKEWNKTIAKDGKLSLGGACDGGNKDLNITDVNVWYK